MSTQTDRDIWTAVVASVLPALLSEPGTKGADGLDTLAVERAAAIADKVVAARRRRNSD